jgi:hypothetical protein
MLAELTPAQLALAEYMSELSEAAFHAGWMKDVEHGLWRAVHQGPYLYGRLMLTEQHVFRLIELSAACGGWIHFHETKEESFVPAESWTSIYQSSLAT